MSNKVESLDLAVKPCIQMDALALLCSTMGRSGGQQVIERAAYEISDRLWMIEQAREERDYAQLRRLASSLVAISKQIGLIEVAMVAEHLADCARQEKSVPLDAVAARLQRAGERSLRIAVEYPKNA